MTINGKVHCFFEQSGTFKREFIKLGIPAEDYDIQDNFGETDHVIDLFAEIENAYRGGQSVFDSITCDDLIMAFFPCIYFETVQMMYYDLTHRNVKHLSLPERINVAIDRIEKRTEFHILLYKLVHAAASRGLRLVIENPAGPNGFITSGQNFIRPAFVDKDRTRRGDYYVKPTAYFFINCEPMTGYFTEQQDKQRRTIESAKSSSVAGLCSEERSMISPDYARNFICDFLLGKEQPEINPTLFNSL